MPLSSEAKWAIATTITVSTVVVTAAVGYGGFTESINQAHRENERQDKEIAEAGRFFRDEISRVEQGFWRWGAEKDKQLDILFRGFDDRLKRTEDKAFGALLDFKPHYADVLIVDNQPRERLFEKRLRELRAMIDSLILHSKDPTLTEEQTAEIKDNIWSLEIDYQILLTRRFFCEIDETRKKQCLALDQPR